MSLVDRRRGNFESVRRLADAGVLTIPALHNPYAVEFRPILISTEEEADEVADRVVEVFA